MLIPLTLKNMIPDELFLTWAWSTLARDDVRVPEGPLCNSTSPPEVTDLTLEAEIKRAGAVESDR